MTSLQDSITALYVEAERNAKDGAPMFAILHGTSADDSLILHPDAPAGDTLPHPDPPDPDPQVLATSGPSNGSAWGVLDSGEIHYQDQPLAARFEALYQLAEREVKLPPIAATAPRQTERQTERRAERQDPDEHLAGKTEAASNNETADDGGPLNDAALAGDLSPVNGDAPEIITPPAAALPEQPPAPSKLGTGSDLDIADIHHLVQQAWEDRDALAPDQDAPHQPAAQQHAPDPTAPEQSTESSLGDAHETATDVGQATDIGQAMENIAAAVQHQHPPAAAALDMDALKAEVVQAVKLEFRQALRDDLAPVIKNIVAEVMADVTARDQANNDQSNNGQAKQAPKTKTKTKAKAAAQSKAKPKARTTSAAKAAAKSAKTSRDNS